MRLSVVFKFLGAVTGLITLGMIIPLVWSLVQSGQDTRVFVEAIGIGFVVSLLLYLGGFEADAEDMGLKEAFLAVALAWAIASAVGAVPYWLFHALPTYGDAYFEAMSGFSTTGSTVIDDVEALPQGIVLWRALTHWIGGMGIILLSVAILPLLGMKSSQLANAETPGPIKEKLTPRIQKTALTLWGLYIALSFTMVLMLWAGGISLFDSVCHAFSTIATGGLSSRNASISHYDSVYLDYVFAFFMFFSGASFTLHYRLLHEKKLSTYWDNAEFRFYLGFIFLGSSVIAISLLLSGTTTGWEHSFRLALLQLVSTTTTTGFTVADYEQWPMVAQAIILLAIFSGACAGSTTGGFKQVRLMILLRHALREFKTILNPRAVVPLRIGGHSVELRVISSCFAFLGVYLFLLVTGTFLVTLSGQDMFTSFSAVLASLGNGGPGFGAIGPMHSYASQPLAAKWLYAFLMLCGRVEVFTVLMLFTPTFWKGEALLFSLDDKEEKEQRTLALLQRHNRAIAKKIARQSSPK